MSIRYDRRYKMAAPNDPIGTDESLTGGGGGGTTSSNTDTNVNTNGVIKLYLSSNENAEFFDGTTSLGSGLSVTSQFSPSLTFGSNRKYYAKIDGKIAKNYFDVRIDSVPSGYNFVTGQQTFQERIIIKEFGLKENSNTDYVEINSKQLLTTTISENLYFSFKPTAVSSTQDAVSTPTLKNYEIAFNSNFKNELGDILKLDYKIVNGSDIVDSDSLKLSSSDTDGKKISSANIEKSEIYFTINGSLPAGFSYTKFYYTSKNIAETYPTDFSKWTETTINFKVSAKELEKGGVAVYVALEKEIAVPKPTINLTTTSYAKQVKDSDSDTFINIDFTSTNSDFIDVYITQDNVVRVNPADGFVKLSFKNNFKGIFGQKKIYLVPIGNTYGTGDKVEVIINFATVNDFPSITEISFPDTIDVPSFSDLQIDYNVTYKTFAVSSVDVDLLLKDKTKVSLLKNLTPNGSFKINLRTLAEKYPKWNGNDNVTLILKPYNKSGEIELVGNEYEIKTDILYPAIKLDEDIIKKSIYDAFIEKLKFLEPEKESKYLTHLANFGNADQVLITSWEEDNWTLSSKKQDTLGNEIVDKEVKSTILKLYSPLPAGINTNSTFWITKLLTNPLIETVVLNEQDDVKCPPIKGPNFNVEVDFVTGKSTGYESLDDLILSGSVSSSANLVSTYLSSSFIDTDSLNIEYASGSAYLWNNFVHFSSAKERVDNFVYKVQLIELYENLILSASVGAGSIAELNEKERQTIKKNQIIQGFDGFEKFLYTSSSFTLSTASSLTWPYNGTTRLNSSTATVTNWYENIIELAETYDIQNSNWVQNNIPQYIVTNAENDSLLLFFSMIGQHFDNIYYHTKAIEKGRGLGYKANGGISDKILFDTLKSFGWDAKNLAADSKLWEYAFGLDSNGSVKYQTPAKKRTYEVWRRIVNNLPYLLKHKGTRRGIYALMACYGIPSSNLSILEFGGPEVSDESKGKYEFDNITTGLKITSGSYVEFEWRNTERNRKPDTIEFFVKPTTAGNYNVITSDNGMVLNMSGSGETGVLTFSYGGGAISSSLLPIFNNKFFGIEVSREVSGSYHNFELNIRQAEKERSIFQQSVSSSIADTNSSWNNGSYIRLGNDFVGSVDEFRLWSTPLDKERFYEHVSFPEMVNGNHVSASTDDLYFRLDFEYPKNLAATSSLINVDANIYFSGSTTRNDYEDGLQTELYSVNPSASYSASAYNFPASYTYPYQFEVIDRTVVVEMPDAGSSRYSTNKVRFESQYTLTGEEISGSVGVDLSYKSRATKKAFDQSPTDSNRVGLFFSPTKELNIDIAKSLGGLNLDNYIGDPSDRYKDRYKRLDDLRHYYFQRFDGRDIYQYINLIKLYEKSMFEDIKKMLPARVKATTGLLIEPHFLERSKIAKSKPTAENEQHEVDIHYNDTTFVLAENTQKEALIDANLGEKVSGENEQYEGIIYTGSIERISSDSYQYETNIGYETSNTADYYQKTASIDAGLANPTILSEIDIINSNIVVGQTDYETIGFGIYAQNGYAIRTYIDENNRTVKERIKVDLIKEQKRRDIVKYKVVVNGKGDERGGVELTSSVYYETYLNVQPFSGSKTINAGTGSIVSVTPLNGYLPTHFRNTSDLTRGLENSFFRGSKNTAATTLDGTPPVEVFTTNPNTLRVNKAGRDASEPILEVE
jgi:hypothetical protein